MTEEEIRHDIEFLLEHPNITISNEADLEHWRKVAPSSLHPMLERQLELKAMSLRQLIDYLTVFNRSLREMIEEINDLNAQTNQPPIDCDIETAVRMELRRKKSGN